MGCNCGNKGSGAGTGTAASVSQRSLQNQYVNSTFEAARQRALAKAPSPRTKSCPHCRSYTVRAQSAVVRCPVCGTTFSAK